MKSINKIETEISLTRITKTKDNINLSITVTDRLSIQILQLLKDNESIMNSTMPTHLTAKMKWKNSLNNKNSLLELLEQLI